MRGSQKLKRVSWASDGNLCQVRLFLSDENPSQVGLGGQDHMQAKASWMLHSHGMGSDDVNLPPGFETTSPADQLKNKFPSSKWSSPSTFVLNKTWRVVAGEESNEFEAQKQREIRVLEAIYPRPSAIPSNPFVATDVEFSPRDEDEHAIFIPITPIEEDETETSPNSADPTHGIATGPMNGSPFSVTPNGAPPGFSGPAPKDLRYYKSLIRQHGDGKQEKVQKPKEWRSVKMKKACMYFNSPKGCRNGSECEFEHGGLELPEMESSKKLKMGR